MPDRKLTQQLFDFDTPRPVESTPAPPATRHQPDEETMSAIRQLEEWLTDPRTGKAVTDLGEEAMFAVRMALVEGKNGYVHRAEDLLEALALRNGRSSGDDIALGPALEDGDFQATVEELLDALAERVNAKGPPAAFR
jgi:hypothetical protein